MNTKEILSTLNKFVNRDEVLGVLSYIEDLREKNQDLREQNIKLQGEIFEYKKEADKHREWEKLRETLEEYQTSEGAVVFRAKDAQPFEKFFCPSCVADHKKLVLLQDNGSGNYKQCPKCKVTYDFKKIDMPGRTVTDDWS